MDGVLAERAVSWRDSRVSRSGSSYSGMATNSLCEHLRMINLHDQRALMLLRSSASSRHSSAHSKSERKDTSDTIYAIPIWLFGLVSVVGIPVRVSLGIRTGGVGRVLPLRELAMQVLFLQQRLVL